MPGILSPTVAPLSETERGAAVRVLARAFRDNPLNRAVIRSEDPEARFRSNLHGMRTLLPVAQARGRVLGARVAGQLAGALVATDPYQYPLPPPAWTPRLRCLLGQGWGVARRWGRVFQVLDTQHPREPVAYLGTLGVDPAHQGRGVGSALLRSWLSHVDRAGTAAYLEVDRPENRAFYGRAGFAEVGETRVEGVPIWRMLRPGAGERAFELGAH